MSEAQQPQEQAVPFTFDPYSTLQLTEAGMELLREKDEQRLVHLTKKLGQYPIDIAQHL